MRFFLSAIAIIACLRWFPLHAESGHLSPTITAAVPQVQVDPDTIHLEVTEGHDLHFDRLSRAKGLSQQRVTQIAQDRQGFIWFGTQYGLNRYDGYQFKIYKNDPDDPRSLGGVFISSLFIDRGGSLWVGGDNGVDRFDASTDSFVHYHPLDTATTSKIDGRVRHISQDAAGILWLSTPRGLYRLDPVTREISVFRHENDNPSSLSSDDVKSSGEDRSGGFWVATREGLDAFDRDTGRVSLHVPLRELRDLSFHEDRFGIFWILSASGDGLAILDRKERRLKRYSFAKRTLPGSPLTGPSGILEAQDGTVWFGTFSDGLLKFDRTHQRFTRYRNDPSDAGSLPENRITTLFEDGAGNIWTGFGATEPAFFAAVPRSFTELPFDSSNPANLGEHLVNVIFEDHNHILWVGTTGALNKIDRNGGYRTHFDIPGNGITSDVLSIAEDQSGLLWVGTSGQGLYRLNEKTGRLQSFRHVEGDASSLSNDTVPQLHVDHTGTLWIATADGLDRYNSGTENFTTFRHADMPAGAPYRTFAEDAQGGFWIGTFGLGLFRFDPPTGQFAALPLGTNAAKSRVDARVNSVFIDHSGAVWLATQNGLDWFDPLTRVSRHYSEKQGLGSNAVSCILEDAVGDLWMGTGAGLSRLNAARSTFRNYSEADGLPGPDMTGWSACARSASGEMFFGGFSGAVAFKPANIKESDYVPPLVLTDFKIFGKSVALGPSSPLEHVIGYTDALTLSHNQNSFSFEFSVLSFRSPATNRYRYKLAGLDTNWHEVASYQRLASYTTLPAGSYQFRVQGATSHGPWSEPGVTIAITIKPPWWNTWWFMCILAVFAVSIMLAIYLLRIRQIAHQFEIRFGERVIERTRIARELHDSLLQGFQGLMFRLQAVRALLPGRVTEAVAALDIALIQGDQAIAEGRDTVQDLRSTHLAGSDLAESLRALGDELCPPEAELVPAYKVLVEGRPRPIAVLVRDEIYRIAREAFRNAVQHAKAQRIEVALEFGESVFHLRIRDDGVGVDTAVLESKRRAGHWGLQGMRERADAFGARLTVWSERGAGTEIELAIPAKTAYGTSVRRTQSSIDKRSEAEPT